MLDNQANSSLALYRTGDDCCDEVVLSDQKIETKVVLEHFLRLIEDATLDPGELSSDGWISDAILNQFIDLLHFLRKWCDEYLIMLFCYRITVLLCQGSLSGKAAFIFGVLANNLDLCATAVSIDFQPSMLHSLPAEVWEVGNTAHLYVLSALEHEVGQAGSQGLRAGARYRQLYEERWQPANR